MEGKSHRNDDDDGVTSSNRKRTLEFRAVRDDGEDRDEEGSERTPKRYRARRAVSATLSASSSSSSTLSPEEDESFYEGGGAATKTSEENEERTCAFDFSETKPGAVMEVYMSNFMCHKAYRVRLGPHLNFIGGKNGKGKSAIMAAIQVCLGLSASDTGRATRLVDLIRRGAPEGTRSVVGVRLSNEGDDAFDSRRFGKSIVIERTISSKSPFSTFRIMTHGKRVTSKEKSLVEEICDRFNLNMRNPLCALDQNLAKEFIQGKKEKIYQFFLEATELQKVREEYRVAQKDSRDTASLGKVFQDSVKRAEAKFRKLDEEVREHEAVREAAESKRRLLQRKRYAEFREYQAEVKEREGELETLKGTIAKKNAQIERAEAKIQTLAEEKAKLQKRKETFAESVKGIVKNYTDGLKAESSAKRAFEHAEAKKESAAREVSQQKEVVRNAEKRLQELERRAAQSSGAEARRLTERLNRVRAEANDLKRQVDEARKACETYRERELQPIEEKVSGLTSDLDSHERDLRDKRNELDRLQRVRSNQAARFGRGVPKLLRLIEEGKARFSKGPVGPNVPVGPVGMYVERVDPRWALAVEVATSMVLESFVVDNYSDKRTLESMAREAKVCNLRCVISKFRDRIRIPRRPSLLRHPQVPPNSISPVYLDSVITVREGRKGDQAFNALVDQASIDMTGLFATHIEAKKNVHNRSDLYPPGIRIVMKDGSTAESKRQRWTSYRNTYGHRLKYFGGGRIGSDDAVSNEMDQIKLVIERTTKDLEAARDERATRLGDFKEKTDAMERLVRKHAAKTGTVDYVTQQLRSVQQDASEEADRIEQEMELRSQKDELEELELSLTKATKTLASTKEALRAANAKLSLAKKEHDGVDEEKEKLKQDLFKNATKSSRISKATRRLKNDLVPLERKLKTDISQLAKQRERLKKRRTKLLAEMKKTDIPEEERADYKDARGRMPPTVDEVDREIAAIEKKLRCQHGIQMSIEDFTLLEKRRDDAAKDYEELKTTKDETTRRRKALIGIVRAREAKWLNLRKRFSEETRVTFKELCNATGMDGTLTFDHESESLGFKVVTNADQTQEMILASQVEDANQLCGGERSRLALILLCAMWKVTEPPIHMMDEPDVFMDVRNRRHLVKLVVKSAQEYYGRQFIFLTPLDYRGFFDDLKRQYEKEYGTKSVLDPSNFNHLEIVSD